MLGVRPEHVRFADDGGVRGEVFGAEYLGATQIVTVDTEAGQVKARLPAEQPARRVGETVGLAFDAERSSLFDKRERAARMRIGAARAEAAAWLRSGSTASPSASATIAAVRDLSLDVGDGEFVVLLGPTGAGKTTTLRLVAGLERPDAGTIAIGGRDVTAAPPAARDVALVFQQYLALSASVRCSTIWPFPLRSPVRRDAGGRRSGSGCRRSPTLLRIEPQARQPGDAALRRRDAARRDRPRAGAPAARST